MKLAFAKDKVVSTTDFKVETDNNGLVQLSDTVKTQAEAYKAVEITKNTRGVTAVKSDVVVAK